LERDIEIFAEVWKHQGLGFEVGHRIDREKESVSFLLAHRNPEAVWKK
jgi:hypothetical protein